MKTMMMNMIMITNVEAAEVVTEVEVAAVAVVRVKVVDKEEIMMIMEKRVKALMRVSRHHKENQRESLRLQKDQVVVSLEDQEVADQEVVEEEVGVLE